MSENPSSFDLNGTQAPPPSSGGSENRSFILIVSILVGVFLIAVLGMAAYVIGVVLPKNRTQSTQAAQINFANTSTVSALTQVATLSVKSATPVPPTITVTPTPSLTLAPTSKPILLTPTGSSLTSEPTTLTLAATSPKSTLIVTLASTNAPNQKSTNTPVLAVASSTFTKAPLNEVTVDPRTATVSALLTQAFLAQQQTGTGTIFPTSTGLPKTGFAEDIGFPSLLGLTLLLIAVIFIVRRLRASPSA